MRLLFDRSDVRVVLPGTLLPLGENGNYLVNYFKDKYNNDKEKLEEAKTLPGNQEKGGRIDQIFTVVEDREEDIDKIKYTLGTIYAKDVVRNGDLRLYN